MIANGLISMGDAVVLSTTPATELLPRATANDTANEQCYGIAVGGDADGIYGDGAIGTATSGTTATNVAGEAVVVVTQGRCPARVTGAVAIGDALVAEGTGDGLLVVPAIPAATDRVIAIALQVNTSGAGIIAVDVQREVGVAA